MINVKLGVPTATPPISGAAGDGVTNDTSVLQQMLDYIETTGGVAFFPAGTYLVDQLKLGSDVGIEGESAESTSILQSAPPVTPQTIVATVVSKGFLTQTNTSALGTRGISIKSITINGNKSVQASDAVIHGIAIYGVAFQLADLLVTNATGHGIYTEWGGLPNATAEFLKHGQGASFSNIQCFANSGCGFLIAGPNDPILYGCQAFGNGKKWFGPNVPSNPDEGAANIWLARRRVPTAYVAINNVSETESDVVLSCCGQSYGQGAFVYPKNALYRNAWGYAYVKVPETPSQNGYFGPIINVQMVSIEGLPANTPIEMVALRYENTEVGWTEATFSIRLSGSNEVFVNLPPVSGDNANEAGYAKKDPGFTGGTGGTNYKIWPTLLQRGPSTEGGISTVALPIVQGGKITGAHILVPGTKAVANKTYFVVEPNAPYGRYAVGVVTDVTGTGAAVIRFGDPGALLSTANGTAPLPNPIQAKVKIANTESNIIFYPGLNDYGEVIQWQRETGPALADPTIKVAQISAVLNGTNSGGALVTQAHVYGSNTWGIRLGVAAMLNGCEAEGARAANILLDGGFNGSIDDCWLYDAGGSYKGSGVPTGTSAPIGIQVGGFATPGNWRISGHAERLTHGAIVLRGSAQGIVAQLQISDYFGRPYDPNLETITGNDYDFSVFKLSTTAATARDQNLSLFAKRSQTLISARARLTQPALVEQVITSSTTLDPSKGTLIRINAASAPIVVTLPFIIKDLAGLLCYLRISASATNTVTLVSVFGTTVGESASKVYSTPTNLVTIPSQSPAPGDWSLWL